MSESNTIDALLIRRASLFPDEARFTAEQKNPLVDVLVEGGRITQISHRPIEDHQGTVLEAEGGVLLPGLWDHHLHLMGTAAALASVQCGPPAVDSAHTLQRALQQKAQQRREQNRSEWIRGVGFHESVCPQLDRYWLDDCVNDVPVRIQHRSGMMWYLNSRAIESLGVAAADIPADAERDDGGKLTGRFYNMDAWLGERFPSAKPPLAQLSQTYLQYGVTGVTDTGVNNTTKTLNTFKQLQQYGELHQRICVMGNEDLHQQFKLQHSNFEAETSHVDSGCKVFVGPLKIYLREVDLPDLDELIVRIQNSHHYQRPVAIHCVTLAELHFALFALESAGVIDGDRIEHASITDDAALDKIFELGITVVSQPHFIAERGEQYMQDVAEDELPWLYRAAGFLHRGVAFAAGSDAPYGGIDPWQAMRHSVSRQVPNGLILGEMERLAPMQALNTYTGWCNQPGGGMRQLKIGQVADLCLINGDVQTLLKELNSALVKATIVDGVVLFQR